MSKENDNTIVLIDEEGEEMEFEYLDTVMMNSKEYVVLLPAEEADKEEVSEVVILRVDRNEEEGDSFLSIEDSDELNQVFEEFKKVMQDQLSSEE